MRRYATPFYFWTHQPLKRLAKSMRRYATPFISGRTG
jgi:hypothetical protein